MRGPQAGMVAKPLPPGSPVSAQPSPPGPAPPTLSWSSHRLSPVTPADGPCSNVWETQAGSPLQALTLEGGPLTRVPVPAPLQEAQEVTAGTRPGSADGRQLGAVALHYFHHYVQDVFLVCKGKVHKSGQLCGAGAGFLLFGRKHNCGKVGNTTAGMSLRGASPHPTRRGPGTTRLPFQSTELL